jgi:hypothetical protein
MWGIPVIVNLQTEQEERYDDIPDFFGNVWITVGSASRVQYPCDGEVEEPFV